MNLLLNKKIDHDKAILILADSSKKLKKILFQNKLTDGISEDYLQWDYKKKGLFVIHSGKNLLFLDQLTSKNRTQNLQKQIQNALNLIEKLNENELQIIVDPAIFDDPLFQQLALICFKSSYRFDKYKAKKTKKTEKTIYLIVPHITEEHNTMLQEAKILANGIKVAKDLTNEPANVIYPETLADYVLQLGKEKGFQVQIYNQEEIENFGMKAFLSVAQGALHEPKLIVMKQEGNPNHPEDILGFVGKGLTYDSGGYSLKSSAGMVTMKADMAGSAAVIGAMSAIAEMKLKCNVVGVIAACENLISDKAYKPGDVIQSMAGKTIEIGNTDAEGRLTLIDAAFYAVKQEKVTRLIDIATLTGAVVVGLGTVRSGVISNDDDLYHMLEQASEFSQERFWRLPHDDDYEEQLKSDIADTNNVGGRPAGTITAALFIRKFIPDSVPWLHLDIAGTAFQTSLTASSKGATGVPVSTLYHIAKKIRESKK